MNIIITNKSKTHGNRVEIEFAMFTQEEVSLIKMMEPHLQKIKDILDRKNEDGLKPLKVIQDAPNKTSPKV